MGHGLSSNMAAPYETLYIILEILKFFNYSYFAKIMTRKPEIGNLTDMTELYPFLESKMYLLFKGVLWSRDLFVKTSNYCGIKGLSFECVTVVSLFVLTTPPWKVAKF